MELVLFWASCLLKYNVQPLWHTPSAVKVVFSDVSDIVTLWSKVHRRGCVKLHVEKTNGYKDNARFHGS